MRPNIAKTLFNSIYIKVFSIYFESLTHFIHNTSFIHLVVKTCDRPRTKRKSTGDTKHDDIVDQILPWMYVCMESSEVVRINTEK